MSLGYKKSLLFEDRLRKANSLIARFPGRVPVICEKYYGHDNPDIDKNKYLVPVDTTMGQFLMVIRQRIKLKPNEAIFLFVNSSIIPTGDYIGDVYANNKDHDNLLYITYSKENTFG
jgi:GABA(A) receptor-associated protein